MLAIIRLESSEANAHRGLRTSPLCTVLQINSPTQTEGRLYSSGDTSTSTSTNTTFPFFLSDPAPLAQARGGREFFRESGEGKAERV